MTVIDPLIVDAYSRDLGGVLDLEKLAAAGEPWDGIILKATEGENWGSGTWFAKYWPKAKSVAGDRFGVTWRRGAYHYAHFREDPVKQRDFYLNTVEAAGGFDVHGDFKPIIDVERADNPDCSANQIIDFVSKFADGMLRAIGVRPILYGGSLLFDKGIKDHMGCVKLWIARYTATLPHVVYERIGWDLKDVILWQYDGDGESYLVGYPATSPIGKLDISADIGAGGIAAAGW